MLVLNLLLSLGVSAFLQDFHLQRDSGRGPCSVHGRRVVFMALPLVNLHLISQHLSDPFPLYISVIDMTFATVTTWF